METLHPAAEVVERHRIRGLVATFALLGASLAVPVAANKLADGPANCIQDSGDLTPTIAPTECLDDLWP